MRGVTLVVLAAALLLGACQTGTTPNLVHTLAGGALPILPASKARIYVLGEPSTAGNFTTPVTILNDQPLFTIDSGKYFVVDVEADKVLMLRTELNRSIGPSEPVRTFGFYNSAPKAGEELFFQLKYTGLNDVRATIVQSLSPGSAMRPRTYNFTRIEPDEARAALQHLSLSFYNSL